MRKRSVHGLLIGLLNGLLNRAPNGLLRAHGQYPTLHPGGGSYGQLFRSCYRTHQHGIASTVSLTITGRMRKVLAIPRSSRGVVSVCFSSDIVVLLFMTLLKHLNCFVSSVATDDRDGRG